MNDQVRNIGNAAVIIACIYFLIQVQSIWAKIGLIIILLFAICTWGIHTFPQISKDLANAQINEVESRTRLNNSNAAFTTANALYLREQAIWHKNKR